LALLKTNNLVPQKRFPFWGALLLITLVFNFPVLAQTNSEAVALRPALPDSSGPTLTPPSSSPRPEDVGIVPIGTSSPSPTTPAPVTLEDSDSSLRSLEDFYGPNEGPVFRTAVGVNLLQPWSTRFGDQSIYSKTIFNPGIRYDLEAGYNVLPQLRLSVEGDFIYNSIHSVVWGNDTRYGTGSLYQVPVLFNVTYHYLSQGPFRGYVGAGVGANWMVYQSGTVLTDGGSYTSYKWNFAWQFTTGFTYTIQPGFDLDIGYKCLSMPNPNFADFGTSHAMFNHTAEIGLAWRF
jgi:opacity protein-like surface antigen